MDLVDRIETTRFLGSEFLLWLWFAGDVTEGKVETATHGVVEVSLETQLKLADPLSQRETVVLRGDDPCGSAEADQALKSGKLPEKALLRVKHGEMEWLLVLDAPSLGLSAIKLPALLDESTDEPLFERMRLLEQIDELMSELYGTFLNVRLAPSWQQELLPALRKWINGTVALDQQSWRRLHRPRSKRKSRR